MPRRHRGLVHVPTFLVLLGLTGCGAAATAPSAPPASTAGSAKPAGSSAAAGASAAGASFAAVLEGAKKEGKVVSWGLFPIEADGPKVQQAFNQRFGTNIQLEINPVAATEVNGRVTAEAQAGRYNVDVIPTAESGREADLVQRGLVAKTDWVGLFGKELPDIQEAAAETLPTLQGYGPKFYDAGYALVYNTKQVKPADLPSRFADLTDAKYRGKLALIADGSPFQLLAVDPGLEPAGAEQLLTSLAANKPLLQSSAPTVVDVVSRGEVPFGIADYLTILTGKANGQPVDIRILDYIPSDSRYMVPMARAPHPNAALLYGAWVVTEGMPLFGELKHTFRLTQPNNPLSQVIQEQNPSAKRVLPKDEADVAKVNDFRAKASAILTGAK